jgi:hypothetical protein
MRVSHSRYTTPHDQNYLNIFYHTVTLYADLYTESETQSEM